MSRRVEIALATLLGGFFGFVACLLVIAIQQGGTPVPPYLGSRLHRAKDVLAEEVAASVVERAQVEPRMDGRAAVDVPAGLAGPFARILLDAWRVPTSDHKPLPPEHVVTLWLRHPTRGTLIRSISLQHERIALGWSGVPWSRARSDLPHAIASLCEVLGSPEAPHHSAYVAGGWIADVRRGLPTVREADRAPVEALLAAADAWIAAHPERPDGPVPVVPNAGR